MIFHECGQLNHFISHVKKLHQIEWFQVWFFKNFLGRSSPSPLPRPLPRFFSGFALGSSFALNSRALHALDSGFALDTRALRSAPSIRASPLTFDWGPWFSPPQKFLDPPLLWSRHYFPIYSGASRGWRLAVQTIIICVVLEISKYYNFL